MHHVMAESLYYAQGLSANSGIKLRDILLGIAGTVILILVVARGVSAYADERYGKIVTSLIAGVPVVGFCYFPEQGLDLLKGLWTTFFGG